MTVTIIRDALPIDVAEQARSFFLSTEFDHKPFEDPRHYAVNFPNGGFGIPDHDEVYCTDFHAGGEHARPLEPIIVNHIAPLLFTTTGRPASNAMSFFYKLNPSGHLRLHKDDSFGHTGFVWHLSRNWKWDWGGLMIAVNGETASATLPVFNTLVIIDHEAAVPHLVTQVMPWAKEPRMMVTGILR